MTGCHFSAALTVKACVSACYRDSVRGASDCLYLSQQIIISLEGVLTGINTIANIVKKGCPDKAFLALIQSKSC